DLVGTVVFPLPLENICQSLGTFLQFNLISHVSLRIDKSKMIFQPLFCRTYCQLINWKRIAINVVSSSVAEDHQHGHFYFPASESGFYLARGEQSLVDVVMHHVPISFQVFFGECDRDLVHYCVADMVGVSDSFPFYDLEILIFNWYLE